MSPWFEGYGEGNRILGVHGPGRFLGGLGVLSGDTMLLTPVAQRASEMLVISTDRLRAALDADRALRDVVVRAYLLRRSHVLGMAAVKIVGSGTSRDARRLREVLTARDVIHSWLDLDTDEHAAKFLQELGVGPDETPVAITRDRRVLRNPSDAELLAAVAPEKLLS